MTRVQASTLVVLLTLSACQSPLAPILPPPPPPPAAVLRAADFATPQLALDAASVWGATLDMGGAPFTAALVLKASPMLIGQVRFVTIENCGGGWSSPDTRPVLSVAPGVNAYFITLRNCLVLGRIAMDRMHNSTLENVWMPTGGLTMTGASYYNRILNLYAGGNCLTATATGGPSTGPNHNLILGGRCQGTMTIGKEVQDWIIQGVAFEGCSGTCLVLNGTRLFIDANRFECNSPTGILLGAGSDGEIRAQYWSSCGTRIAFGPGADILAWIISAQPAQQAPDAVAP